MIKYGKRFIEWDGTKGLEAKVPNDEAWIVEEIGIAQTSDVAGGGYVPLFIENELMLSIPLGMLAYNIFPKPGRATNPYGLMKTVRESFPAVPPLKVLPGEVLKIDAHSALGNCVLIYEVRDPAQGPKQGEAGTRKSDVRFIVLYGKGVKEIPPGETVTFLIDTAINPTPLTDFPFETVCPTGVAMHILALWLTTQGRAPAAITPILVRVWHREESILSPDQAFILIENFAPFRDGIVSPFIIFDEPLVVKEEEEFKIEIQATNTDTTNPQTAEVYAYLLCVRRPLEKEYEIRRVRPAPTPAAPAR